MDSYSRVPSGCRGCGVLGDRHGWDYSCGTPDHRYAAPHDWLILNRMIMRRRDPLRWVPDDGREHSRKWSFPDE